MKLAVALTLLVLMCASRASAQDRIDRFMNAVLKSTNIPGASVVVLKAGQVVKQGAYGLANIEYDAPATVDTPYLLASITKPFTSTAILMLVEEGKLGLDDPIAKHLADAPPAWSPITVRMLLGHAAGLKDRWEETDHSKWRLSYSTSDLYAASRATALDFTPGTRSQYSDQGYFLLGMLIEKLSGQSYRAFLEERIFKPCGMTHSSTTSQTEIVPHIAQGYTRGQGKWLKNHRRTDYGLVSHFGIVASAMDIARFDQALTAGKLLKKETLRTAWTPVRIAGGISGAAGASLGLGWFLEETNGHRIVQHAGSTGTAYLKFPDDDVTVIVLTNLEQLAGGDAMGIARIVAQAYVPGLRFSDMKPKPDPSPEVGRNLASELTNMASGRMDATLYTEAFAAQVAPTLPRQQAGFAPLGPITKVEFLGDRPAGNSRMAYYRVQYAAVALYATVSVTTDGRFDFMSVSTDIALGD